MAESAVQALTPIPLDLTEKEPLQILHVDDDVGFLKVAKYCLETQGPHQVDTAQSVEQAKEKMQQKTYDALVCDYKMPEEDGLQFLKELRDHGNNIPFLIFTGKGREEAAIKALNLGADRYLNKQGDPETVYGELAHAIHQAVKAKLARQAMMESERRYRSIFEEALDAIFVADAETGILLDCNQAASKLVDRDKSELVGKRQRILHPPEQIEGEFSRTFKEHLKEKEGQVLETQVITKNGEIKDVEIKANTLELKGEKLIQGIFRDITERKRIEQKLRNREERLRQALETAVDGVWFIDTEGVTTYVNDAMAEMLGYTKEEMLGKSVLHFASQEEIERFNKLFQRRKKGIREVLQFTFRRKGGERVVCRLSSSPLYEEDKVTGAFAFVRDITEQKKREKKLRESEERYRLLAEYSADVIYRMNIEDEEFTYVSPSVETVFGYTPEEALALKPTDVLTPESFKKQLEAMQRDLSRDRTSPKTLQLEAFHKDGRTFPIEIHATFIPNEKGKPVEILGVCRDITEQKQAEEKREQLLHDLGERVKELRCLYQMSKLVENPDLSMEEILGKTVNLLPPAWQYPDIACARIVLDGQEFETEDFQKTEWKQQAGITVQGEEVGTVEVYYSQEKPTLDDAPFLKEERDLIEAVAERLGRVIERERAEEEIKWRNKQLAALNAITTSMMQSAFDLEEICQQIADGFVEALGCITTLILLLDEEEEVFKGVAASSRRGLIPRINSIIGSPLFQLQAPAKPGFNEAMDNILDGRMTIKQDLYRLVAPVLNRPVCSVLKKIIGSRTFLSVPLQAKGKLVGAAFMSTRKGMEELDTETMMTFATQAAIAIQNTRLYDETQKEIIRRRKAEQAAKESQQKFRRLFLGSPEAAVYVDQDFHILEINPRFTELFGWSLDEIEGQHIDDIVVPIEKREEAESLNQKVKEGYVYHDTVRRTKDGSMIPVSISAAPIIVDGRLVGHVGLYNDISDLKKTEERLEETLEKLHVVGRLTRHDVRNRLSSVTGNTYLLKQQLKEDDKALKYLVDIQSAVQQAVRIFDFARTYEQLGMEELEYLDVGQSVEWAVQQFSDLDVEVVNECRGLRVLADSLLSRLFYTLIHNSLQHGEDISQIRVYYQEEQDQLKLIYEDDGVGIPQAEKEKIFQEGYGRGTGYGLYLIQKMCEVYGWNIKETGTPGQGVRFTMTIPQESEAGGG